MSLRLLTWNVKFLPKYAKMVLKPFGPTAWWETGGRASDEVRAERCLKAMLAGDWDVIALQELFEEGIRAKYRAAFEAAGYTTTPALGNDVLHEDSGLFVASRIPMHWFRFVEYAAKWGQDALSDKGIGVFCLDTSTIWGPERHSLYLFPTHLQSDDRHYAVRLLQLDQLRSVIHATLARVPDLDAVSAIACGDFNVRAEQPVLGVPGAAVATSEYAALQELLGRPRDVFREAHPAAPGFTWDGKINAMTRDNDNDQKRLDYIFAFDFVPQPLREAQTAALGRLDCSAVAMEPFLGSERHLSDHFGVSASFAPRP